MCAIALKDKNYYTWDNTWLFKTLVIIYLRLVGPSPPLIKKIKKSWKVLISILGLLQMSA